MIHEVGDVDGVHLGVVLDRHVVELGERLVLVFICLVHEVAVRALRVGW